MAFINLDSGYCDQVDCAGLEDHRAHLALRSPGAVRLTDCEALGKTRHCAGLEDHRPHLPLRNCTGFPCLPCLYILLPPPRADTALIARYPGILACNTGNVCKCSMSVNV
eukprot:1161868-Pelagomonas_calceolata.AAC.7